MAGIYTEGGAGPPNAWEPLKLLSTETPTASGVSMNVSLGLESAHLLIKLRGKSTGFLGLEKSPLSRLLLSLRGDLGCMSPPKCRTVTYLVQVIQHTLK